MLAFLWSGFVVGLLGSFHCVGMCGPIVLALPGRNKETSRLLVTRLLYNLGRTFTYMILGAIVGLLGKSLALTFSQQWLSIGMGVLILLLLFVPKKISHKINVLKPIQKITTALKKQFAYFFQQKSYLSFFIIGVLNGFLPCGLVYIALMGAIAMGEWTTAIFYMGLFGLGTIPMLLGVALAGNFIKPKFRTFIYQKFVPVFTACLAILFIVRGMNLGIQYMSPKISKASAEIECCHK